MVNYELFKRRVLLENELNLAHGKFIFCFLLIYFISDFAHFIFEKGNVLLLSLSRVAGTESALVSGDVLFLIGLRIGREGAGAVEVSFSFVFNF